jgi:hypothetical protein
MTTHFPLLHLVKHNQKRLLERLDAYSDVDRSITYSIIAQDDKALPGAVYNYRGVLSFSPVTEGNLTYAVWKTRYRVCFGSQSDKSSLTASCVVLCRCAASKQVLQTLPRWTRRLVMACLWAT